MKTLHDKVALSLEKLEKKDREILETALSVRDASRELFEQERYMDALERNVAAMKMLREFSNYDNKNFRHVLVILLFDIAEIHFYLKDYRQSEKEIEVLFKVLDPLLKTDADMFGSLHILAMELSTRILRSRKKVMEMLVKQKINADELYEKVNSGVAAATDKLVDSLRKVGELLAAAGDYRGALKFYAEAIKFSKKRTGRITRREVKLTIEMAEIMMRVRSLRPRAKRLLNAILPHAISLETLELEDEILALTEIVENEMENETRWRQFLQKISLSFRRDKKETSSSKKDSDKKESASKKETSAKKTDSEKKEAKEKKKKK